MIIEMIMNLGSIPQQVFNDQISVTVNGSPSSDLEMFRSIQTVAKNVIKADFYMTSECDIQCININFLRNKCIQNKSTLRVSTDSKMVCTNNSLVVAKPLTGKANIITPDKVTKAELPVNNIKSIGYSSPHIIAAGENGIIHITSEDNISKSITDFCVVSESMTAVCYS